MTTSSLAFERRYRRRRQIAVFLTLAVVVAVVALAVRYRTEQRETSEYLALTNEIANSQLAVSEGLRGLFDALGDLDRSDILTRIETLSSDAADAERLLAEATVTRPAATLHGFMTVAVTSWSQGLATLGEAVVGVMDSPATPDGAANPADPAAALSESLGSLRVGDRAYAGFLEAVPALGEEYEPPSYPEVVFVASDQTDIDGIADTLVLSQLQERHDVTLTVNVVPEPTGERNGIPVLPFTSSLDATVVVSNAGNVLQEEIEVSLQLAPDGGGEEPDGEVRIIPALEPGASMTMEFVDFPLEPGALYNLQVTASIVDDAAPDNNIWQVLFAVNSE